MQVINEPQKINQENFGKIVLDCRIKFFNAETTFTSRLGAVDMRCLIISETEDS